MHTRVSCASKSSRPMKHTSFVATTASSSSAASSIGSRKIHVFAVAARPLEFDVIAVAENPAPTLRVSPRAAAESRRSSAWPTSPRVPPDNRMTPLAVRFEPRALDATAVRRVEVRLRHQRDDIAVTGLVHREHDASVSPCRVGVGCRIEVREFRTDDRFDARVHARIVELDQAEQIGTVGDRDRRHAERHGAIDQILHLHQTVGDRVLGVDLQMDEAAAHRVRPRFRTSPRRSSRSSISRIGAKLLPVQRTRPESFERFEMRSGGVAFVSLETVVRIMRGRPIHLPIANDLCNDRCRADRRNTIVAADDRNRRHRKTSA